METIVFHKESVEWLSNLRFYKDELTFFSATLEHFLEHLDPVPANNKIFTIYETLKNLNDRVSDLEQDVQIHETYLGKARRGISGYTKEGYMALHKPFGVLFTALCQEIQEFLFQNKKPILEIIRKKK